MNDIGSQEKAKNVSLETIVNPKLPSKSSHIDQF